MCNTVVRSTCDSFYDNRACLHACHYNILYILLYYIVYIIYIIIGERRGRLEKTRGRAARGEREKMHFNHSGAGHCPCANRCVNLDKCGGGGIKGGPKGIMKYWPAKSLDKHNVKQTFRVGGERERVYGKRKRRGDETGSARETKRVNNNNNIKDERKKHVRPSQK